MIQWVVLPFALAIPSTASVATTDSPQWAAFLAREENYIASVMPHKNPMNMKMAGSTNCGTSCGTTGDGTDDIKNDIAEDTA
jgi:hypothetical protein